MSTRRQILRDARLALIVTVVVFLLGVLIGRASACDSFDSCINKPEKIYLGGGAGGSDGGAASYLKAIALKLDEISKKLDYSDKEISEIRMGKETLKEHCPTNDCKEFFK